MSDGQVAVESPREVVAAAGPDSRIDDYFHSIVDSAPDRPALVTGTATYSYRDIERWSQAIAADVVAAGTPTDRPVAIVTSSNVVLVPAMMGVVMAGHYFVMIDSTDPEERIELLLRESAAALCLTDAAGSSPATASLRNLPIRPFDRNAAPIVVRTPANPLVHVVYTSGTTGKPKAVATPQDGFVPKIVEHAHRFGSAPGVRRSYNVLPGYTRAASTVFQSLMTGSTMCAFDARSGNLAALADAIAAQRVELLNLTPSLFRRLLAAAPPGLDFSHVRTLRLTADRVTAADVEAFRRYFPSTATLTVGFASTETGGVFGMRIGHDTPIDGPLVPMGRPLEGVDVRLVDDEGAEVASGETGEIVVSSPHVIKGYWNDPELTALRFSDDPERPGIRRFRTGDLARQGPDGLYYFVGRKDARLKIHGRRIDPSEVEAAILATGCVREAVVVGKADARSDQELVAFVVPSRDELRSWSARELRASLRGSVPAWMIPARIVELESIPMTRAAKVDRTALIERTEDVPEEEQATADPLEQQVARIWSRVIGQPVHSDDDFFDDLGGDSLMAAHISTEIERETGKPIAPSLLIELNSVSKMVAYLRGAEEAVRHVIEIQKGTSALPPLFCAAGGGGGVLGLRPLAIELGPEQPFHGLQMHSFEVASVPKTFAGVAAAYVHAIRRIQQSGPYYLAGYSVGGKLVYEMARQLHASGERVAFLGVIDTSVSDARVSAWHRLRNRLDILWRNPRRAAAFAQEAAVRPSKWMMNRVIQKLLGRGIAVPAKIIQNTMMFRGMTSSYVPGPYDGVLTLFLAKEGIRKVRIEQDLGWSAVGVGRLELVEVEGNHGTMLTWPHVTSIADAMRRSLAEARALSDSA
ncbi:MAG TPA: AMP-binding protein [Thermoanaerobaculia bacterium]